MSGMSGQVVVGRSRNRAALVTCGGMDLEERSVVRCGAVLLRVQQDSVRFAISDMMRLRLVR